MSNQNSIKPMQLKARQENDIERYLSNPLYAMQEKYDGERLMIYIARQNEVYSYNKRGDLIANSPIITGSVKKINLAPIDYHISLDGEFVKDKFFVFDMITDLNHKHSYEERYSLLRNFIYKHNPDNIVHVPNIKGEKVKRAFLNNLHERRCEGAVFKRTDSLYRPAKRCEDQVKIKFYQTCSVICLGQGRGKSVRMGMMNSGEIIEVGAVSIEKGPKPQEGDIIEVKYLYAYQGGSLYQPIYLKTRTDVIASECLTDQLVYKQ